MLSGCGKESAEQDMHLDAKDMSAEEQQQIQNTRYSPEEQARRSNRPR